MVPVNNPRGGDFFRGAAQALLSVTYVIPGQDTGPWLRQCPCYTITISMSLPSGMQEPNLRLLRLCMLSASLRSVPHLHLHSARCYKSTVHLMNWGSIQGI